MSVDVRAVLVAFPESVTKKPGFCDEEVRRYLADFIGFRELKRLDVRVRPQREMSTRH